MHHCLTLLGQITWPLTFQLILTLMGSGPYSRSFTSQTCTMILGRPVGPHLLASHGPAQVLAPTSSLTDLRRSGNKSPWRAEPREFMLFPMCTGGRNWWTCPGWLMDFTPAFPVNNVRWEPTIKMVTKGRQSCTRVVVLGSIILENPDS